MNYIDYNYYQFVVINIFTVSCLKTLLKPCESWYKYYYMCAIQYI